jgi:hypothetical protein
MAVMIRSCGQENQGGMRAHVDGAECARLVCSWLTIAAARFGQALAFAMPAQDGCQKASRLFL